MKDPNVELEPCFDYQYSFPENFIDLTNITYAYSWVPLNEDGTPSQDSGAWADYNQLHPNIQTMNKLAQDWKSMWKQDDEPTCEYRVGAGFVRIKDCRNERTNFITLNNEAAAVFLLCDRVLSEKHVVSKLSDGFDESEVRETIDALCDIGLLMRENGKLLTLPIGQKPRSTEELDRLAFGMYQKAICQAAK